jgi:hypothetical protein
LRINPHADPNVIFRVNNYQMTVGALQDVGHECLAQAVGLSLPDFEAAIIAWAKGDGLPYGVLVPEMHICKPGDRTMTLCERIAAREAAINYSERMLGHGPYCATCEALYQQLKKIDDARED